MTLITTSACQEETGEEVRVRGEWKIGEGSHMGRTKVRGKTTVGETFQMKLREMKGFVSSLSFLSDMTA